MAYQSSFASPQTATWKTERMPVIGSPLNRIASALKDQRFVNCFPETLKIPMTEEKYMALIKRPGLSTYQTGVTGEGRGCYYFAGAYYTVIGDTLYKDAVAVTTLGTSTGPVGWTEHLVDTTKTLFMADGINGYVITSSGVATKLGTDQVGGVAMTSGGTGYSASFTVTFTGGGGSGATGTATSTGGVVTSVEMVNLGSGYTSAPTPVFTAGGGSGAVGTASLNAFPTPHVPTPVFADGFIFLPKVGTADIYNCEVTKPKIWMGDFITAEQFPEGVTGLARQNNMVLAFGNYSTEFFFDAANATGSPLQRNDSLALQFGTLSPYAIFQAEKFCACIGTSATSGRAVWIIDGFEAKKVSTEAIERILNAEGAAITSARGFGIRVKGHMFFGIVLSTRTLVFDLEEKAWHEWGSNSGSDTNSNWALPYVTDDESGKPIFLHTSSGVSYKMDQEIFQDQGVNIVTEFITDKYDAKTRNRKAMYNLTIVGDLTDSSTPISIRWTDDDDKTWSSFHNLDLVSIPYIARLGTFRHRAFHVKHAANSDLRLEFLEFDINNYTQ